MIVGAKQSRYVHSIIIIFSSSNLLHLLHTNTGFSPFFSLFTFINGLYYDLYPTLFHLSLANSDFSGNGEVSGFQPTNPLWMSCRIPYPATTRHGYSRQIFPSFAEYGLSLKLHINLFIIYMKSSKIFFS